MEALLLWASTLPNIGSKTVVGLWEKYGVKGDRDRALRDITQTTPRLGLSMNLFRSEYAQQSELLAEHQIVAVPFWSDKYPALLREIPDLPAVLYCKGDVTCMEKPAIAIVGTRTMSEYGKRCVHELVRPLSHGDLAIVSGLAYGVDAEAHTVVLEHETSTAVPVAVLAGGPEEGYPFKHANAYDEISRRGLVVWEFFPGTPLKKNMFAVRNRIIAGMSTSVIVIESTDKGGALITADLALQYGRDVGAVPGSIFNRTSEGTNQLVSEGAQVIRNANDVLSISGVVAFRTDSDSTGHRSSQDTLIRTILLNGLKLDRMNIDSIIEGLRGGGVPIDLILSGSSLQPGEMRSALTKLELEGILRLDSGGSVKLIFRT